MNFIKWWVCGSLGLAVVLVVAHYLALIMGIWACFVTFPLGLIMGYSSAVVAELWSN